MWPVVVHLVVVYIVQVTAQGDVFEGSINLFSNGAKNNKAGRGVLQVYTQGQWTVVCYQWKSISDRVTNSESAIAACKQLGFSNYIHLGSAVKMGLNKQENLHSTAISGIRCPSVKNRVTEGEMFLMRCNSSNQLINSSSCTSFVAIQCDLETTDSDYISPYSGQVRTDVHDMQSPALLEIYFEGEWRPICTNSLKELAAISACRQMGYTSSSKVYYYPSSNYGKSWQINNLSDCDFNSYPCLTDCIGTSAGYNYIAVDQCNKHQFQLICRFAKYEQLFYSAGSQSLCLYPSPHTDHDVRFFAFVGVLSLETMITMILLIVVIVQCRKRCRPNNDPPQPNIVVRWWRGNYGAVNNGQREN